jgi:heme-degrading monooxygenase HmoA
MIKVVISRQIKEGAETKVQEMLMDLRAAALHQPGYVTGETLVSINDPHNILTVGTMTSLEHWKAWRESEQRIELANLLRPFLVKDEEFSIYYLVGREQ